MPYKSLILYNIILTRGLEHLSLWGQAGGVGAAQPGEQNHFYFELFERGLKHSTPISFLLATVLYRITCFYLQHIRCSTPSVFFTNTCICWNSCSPPSFYQPHNWQEQELLSSLCEDISLPCTTPQPHEPAPELSNHLHSFLHLTSAAFTPGFPCEGQFFLRNNPQPSSIPAQVKSL